MSEEKQTEMVDAPNDEMSDGGDSLEAIKAELTRTAAALRKANAEASKFRHQAGKLEQSLEEKRQSELSEMEKLQEALAATSAELQTLKGRELKRRVATSSGLPEALAYRLQGDTEEELAEDAQRLKELLPKASTGLAPTLPANNPGATAREPELTDKQKLARLYSGGLDNFFDAGWARQHGGGVFGPDDNK